MRYTSTTDDIEEAKRRVKMLEEYGTFDDLQIHGSLDVEGKVIDALLDNDDSTEFDGPEELIEYAEQQGITPTVLAKSASNQMQGSFFRIPSLTDYGLEDTPETIICNHLSDSLEDLSDELGNDESTQETDSDEEPSVESESDTESTESESEESEGDSDRVMVVDDEDRQKGGYGTRGIEKDWDGVEQGKRKESTTEFFRENQGEWVQGVDFAEYEEDLDPEDANDRNLASRALLNLFERSSANIEKRKVLPENSRNRRNEYRLRGTILDSDEEEVQSIQEEPNLDMHVKRGTVQHEILAVLDYLGEDENDNWVSGKTIQNFTGRTDGGVYGALSILKNNKEVVEHDSRNSTWRPNETGYSILDALGDFEDYFESRSAYQ